MSWWHEYIDAWNAHDPERIAAFFTSEGIHVGASGRKQEGRDAIVDYARGFTDRFSSDHHVTAISFVRDGDRFAGEWQWVGTFDRENPRWGPPNNARWDIHGVSIGRLHGDKILETADFWDTSRFYRQIGFVPK